jgi:hypothetical protein
MGGEREGEDEGRCEAVQGHPARKQDHWIDGREDGREAWRAKERKGAGGGAQEGIRGVIFE